MFSTTIPSDPTQSVKKTRRNIPVSLVREVVEGIPFYYPGYRSVLNKTKKLEDIMGDSGLQTLLKNTIGDFLKMQIDRKRYYVFAGETGSHLNHRNNFGLDIAIYDRQVLTPDKITLKYIDVPPKIVLEIDVNVEMPHSDGNLFEQYIVPKIQQLFAFGTEKVIWAFTKSKTIIQATAAEQWEFVKWDSDIEVMPGVRVNIARLLEEEGIELD
jgi:hypothetical protein